MQFIDRTEILTDSHTANHAQRRNIRIKSNKLPHDFFNHPKSSLADYPTRYAQRTSRQQPKTPSFATKKHGKSLMERRPQNERKVLTARGSLENTQSEDLIGGIIFSSIRFRRAIRMQSKEITNDVAKGKAVSMQDMQDRLPQILRKGHQRKW